MCAFVLTALPPGLYVNVFDFVESPGSTYVSVPALYVHPLSFLKSAGFGLLSDRPNEAVVGFTHAASPTFIDESEETNKEKAETEVKTLPFILFLPPSLPLFFLMLLLLLLFIETPLLLSCIFFLYTNFIHFNKERNVSFVFDFFCPPLFFVFLSFFSLKGHFGSYSRSDGVGSGSRRRRRRRRRRNNNNNKNNALRIRFKNALITVFFLAEAPRALRTFMCARTTCASFARAFDVQHDSRSGQKKCNLCVSFSSRGAVFRVFMRKKEKKSKP